MDQDYCKACVTKMRNEEVRRKREERKKKKEEEKAAAALAAAQEAEKAETAVPGEQTAQETVLTAVIDSGKSSAE